MTQWVESLNDPLAALWARARTGWQQLAGGRWDLWLLLAAIAALNGHLLSPGFAAPQVFIPAALSAGQWWRLFTHPFVHLSAYHLALDAGAFFLIYSGLDETRVHRRVLYAAVCGGVSLAVAVWSEPAVALIGLCGLSGTAHGLTAVSALEMMRRKSTRTAGAVCLAVLVGKSAWEAMSGRVVLDALHMGMCGTPVAVCHAGGVLGGLLAAALLMPLDRVPAEAR